MAELKLPGLIGKKLGMTHIFTEDGSAVPVTVIEAGPCKITQVKTKDRDGYDALQIGYGPAKESRVNKPLKGHFDAAGTEPFKLLKEFRVGDASPYPVGVSLDVSCFRVGGKVDVIGTSIGKGFTGVVKRHGFHGGPKTHGSKSHDVPGSIGGSAYPSRVWPGKKLPGRAGGERVTIRKVPIVGVDPERNLLMLKGPVPGKRNSIVMLRPSQGFEPTFSADEVEEPAEAAQPAEAAEAAPEVEAAKGSGAEPGAAPAKGGEPKGARKGDAGEAGQDEDEGPRGDE